MASTTIRATGGGRAAASGVHPVDEVPKAGPLAVFGLQHVMSMYAGVVALPIIVGTALNLDFADLSYLLAAALLVSGLATLVQTLGAWRVGARLPIVQGTSFAAVASMLAIGADAGGGTAGLRSIFGAVLVAVSPSPRRSISAAPCSTWRPSSRWSS